MNTLLNFCFWVLRKNQYHKIGNGHLTLVIHEFQHNSTSTTNTDVILLVLPFLVVLLLYQYDSLLPSHQRKDILFWGTTGVGSQRRVCRQNSKNRQPDIDRSFDGNILIYVCITVKLDDVQSEKNSLEGCIGQ